MTACGDGSDNLPDNFSNPSQSSALRCLLEQVAASGYHFITPTPLTHKTVLANRPDARGETLRDIFGWNLPFSADSIAPQLFALMQAAGVLLSTNDLHQCSVRIATLEGASFLHSGYPTIDEHAVFFGPDTYRFIRFIRQSFKQTTSRKPVRRLLDIGCGSGAGGILSARMLAMLGLADVNELQVVLNDINPHALALTAINAQAAKISMTVALGDTFSAVTGEFDLIVCNPPYLDDGQERAYRHGGAGLGRALGIRIAEQALRHLAPGGRLLLYTGVAIVNGKDEFIAALEPFLATGEYEWTYEEIDPDIFGEELTTEQYKMAERIAAVGLTAIRSIGF